MKSLLGIWVNILRQPLKDFWDTSPAHFWMVYDNYLEINNLKPKIPIDDAREAFEKWNAEGLNKIKRKT